MARVGDGRSLKVHHAEDERPIWTPDLSVSFPSFHLGDNAAVTVWLRMYLTSHWVLCLRCFT